MERKQDPFRKIMQNPTAFIINQVMGKVYVEKSYNPSIYTSR